MGKKKFLYVLLLAYLLLATTSCCWKHEWSEATCTTPKTCLKCGKTEGEPLGHKLDYSTEQVVKEASCLEDGIKEYICLRCGSHIQQAIPSIGHLFTRLSAIPSTCNTKGTEEVQCVNCGLRMNRELELKSHNFKNGVCIYCNAYEPVSISMSSSEKRIAESVHYLTDWKVQNEDDHYVFLFGLEDNNGEKVSCPAVIDLRIENDNGEEVYKCRKELSTYDFAKWSNAITGSRILASIEIDYSEITPGSSSNGTAYFTIYNPGYFSFSESETDVYELPLGINSDEIINVNPYTFYSDMGNEIRMKSLYSDKWLEMEVKVYSISKDWEGKYYLVASAATTFPEYKSYYLTIYFDMNRMTEQEIASIVPEQFINIRCFYADGNLHGAYMVNN